MAGISTPVNPALMPPASWRGRRAALLSHGAQLDDPDIVECDAAIAYWKCRRVIDTQRELLAPEHIPALTDLLRHEHPVVPA